MPLLLKRPADLGGMKNLLDETATAAQLSDYKIITLPQHLNSTDEALERLEQAKPSNTWALLSGFYDHSHYQQHLFEACKQLDITMLNTPEDSTKAMSFALYYPLISDLSARSWIVDSEEACQKLSANLDYPVFVKGGIKSLKEQGLESCLATDPVQLLNSYHQIARSNLVGSKTMIVRELIRYRNQGQTVHQFPVNREYRVFVYKQSVIDYGFYWPGADPFGPLTDAEEERLVSLALEAAQRVACPLVAIDCGQLEDLSWQVIEIGDPQYTAITQVGKIEYWQKLKQLHSENSSS